MPLLLNDITLLDGTGAGPWPHMSVLVNGEQIARIGPVGRVEAPDGARIIDAAGMTLMPGLTDAHVHFGITAASSNEEPESHVSYVLKVVENIRIALDEGFTTVRDAGALDPAFALAVEQGQIPGPRILPAGSFLTITGGHGDHRYRFDDQPSEPIAGLLAREEICDGPDAVRAAARRQIRHGAAQVKLMVSGGIMSPSDPIESLQFSVPEIRAAVEEARAFGKYVMAHCHTSAAMNNALEAGVRSIEHGSVLDASTAKRMAAQDAYLVPTLVILDILSRSAQVPEFSRRKLDVVHGETGTSLRTAMAAGVKIGSGSDLLGPRQSRRASELAVKARHMGAMAAIVSATQTNAALFCMEDRIGTVTEGKDADLILIDGDPVARIEVLAEARSIKLVLKSGAVMKDLL